MFQRTNLWYHTSKDAVSLVQAPTICDPPSRHPAHSIMVEPVPRPDLQGLSRFSSTTSSFAAFFDTAKGISEDLHQVGPQLDPLSLGWASPQPPSVSFHMESSRNRFHQDAAVEAYREKHGGKVWRVPVPSTFDKSQTCVVVHLIPRPRGQL